MNFKLAAIFLFLLLPLSTAYWAETISVHVITTDSYPISDEPVVINYQRNVGVESTEFVAISGVSGANCQTAPVTVTEVTFDPVTGVAEVTTSEKKGNCQIGQSYIEPGDDSPEGLSSSSLGVTGPWNMIISEKEIDLRRLDGVLMGRTNSEGIFESGLIDYVSSGEITDYLISVGPESRRVTAGNNWVGTKHVEVFVLDVSIRRVVLRMLDGDRRSLANASIVAICGEKVFQGTTDSSAIFSFYVPAPATCEVSMSYGEISYTEFIHNIEEDRTVDIIAPLFDLSIQVVDDNGLPLVATINVAGFPSNSTDENGRFTIKRFPASSAQVSIIHQNRQQVVQVELTSSDMMVIPFDLTPPTITQVNHTFDESGIVQVKASIRDPGATPSSIATVSLRYSTNKRKWTSLPMHPMSAFVYEASIPAQEPGTTVYYVIEALDDRSNRGISPEYTYLIIADESGEGGGGLPSLGGVNILGFQIDLFLLIPAIVILVIILFKLRSN